MLRPSRLIRDVQLGKALETGLEGDFHLVFLYHKFLAIPKRIALPYTASAACLELGPNMNAPISKDIRPRHK